jgi:hypothetical protein
MNNLSGLIDGYIAMWNEADAARRRELITEVWTENASYLDPVMSGDGQQGIEVMVQGVQERFPGHQFRLTSEIDAHHDRVRFTWELAAQNGTTVVKGTDYGVLAADGRLQNITGFFDQAANQQ